jgi:hypothetical protein
MMKRGYVFLVLLFIRGFAFSVDNKHVASCGALSRGSPTLVVRRDGNGGAGKNDTVHGAMLDRRSKRRKLRIGLGCLFASVGSLASLVHRDAALSFVIQSILNYFVGDAAAAFATDNTLIIQKYIEDQLGGRTASSSVSNLINRVAEESKLPYKLRALYIPSSVATAFTFGDPYKVGDTLSGKSSGAVICYTQGLLDALSFEEFRAVIAHECGHLLHDDYVTGQTHITVRSTIKEQVSDGLWYTLKGAYYATHASRLLEQANRRKKALNRCQLPEASDVRYAELVVGAEENMEKTKKNLPFGAVKSVAAVASSLIGESVICHRPC